MKIEHEYADRNPLTRHFHHTLLLMVIVNFIPVYFFPAGMERHEFKMEFIRVRRRKGFANSSTPAVEARCAYVQ
jgi:hypothetical protein